MSITELNAAIDERLEKAWNPSEHPRYPANFPGGLGGKFAPKPGQKLTYNGLTLQVESVDRSRIRARAVRGDLGNRSLRGQQIDFTHQEWAAMRQKAQGSGGVKSDRQERSAAAKLPGGSNVGAARDRYRQSQAAERFGRKAGAPRGVAERTRAGRDISAPQLNAEQRAQIAREDKARQRVIDRNRSRRRGYRKSLSDEAREVDVALTVHQIFKRALSSRGRKALSDSDFVFPKDRRYPIHDESHARNALARSSGKSEEATVRRAVCKRYPKICSGD